MNTDNAVHHNMLLNMGMNDWGLAIAQYYRGVWKDEGWTLAWMVDNVADALEEGFRCTLIIESVEDRDSIRPVDTVDMAEADWVNLARHFVVLVHKGTKPRWYGTEPANPDDPDVLEIKLHTDMEEGLRRWAYMEALGFQDVPDNRGTRSALPLRMRH